MDAASAQTAAPYTWNTVPFGGGGYVDGFVYHSKKPGILYARTDVGGAYRFDFHGQKWIPLFDWMERADSDLMGVLSIALDPNDSEKVYAATGKYLSEWARKGAILRSSDRGATWQKFELPIRVGGNADGRGTGERLVVDPANGSVLYYGSNRDGLWKSSDGGATFAAAVSPAKSISLVSIDPRDGAIYLGSADGLGALLVSTDGGKSFAPVPDTPQMIPQHMAFAGDGSVLATFGRGAKPGEVNPSDVVTGGVWKREAGGHWKEITPEKPEGGAKFGYSGVDVGPDGTIAVSTIDRWWPGDDVFVSRDGGKSWIGLRDKSQLNYDAYPWASDLFSSPNSLSGWNSDIKINPFNKNQMIFVGPWVTGNLSDAGTGKPVIFGFITEELEETAITQLVSPLHGPKVMASMGDVGGAVWFDTTQSPEEGLLKPNNESNRSIDYAGQNPAIVVRASDKGPRYGYISQDAGLHWTPLPGSAFDAPKWKDHWHTSGVIAMSAGAGSMLWTPDASVASYSKDMGKSWTETAGWPVTRDHKLYPISDKQVEGVFYVYDPAGSILISVDGGASFKIIVTGMPKTAPWDQARLAVVPTRMRDLWLPYPGGLIHSPAADKKATPIANVTAAWAIGFGAPRKPGGYPAVYLAGKIKEVGGIWRSDDEGKNWTRLNPAGRNFEPIGAITGDMREPGTVYIAPGRGGVMVGKPNAQ
ncbi:MAG: hypothetical protein ABIQ66_00170 [Novosphingobium sp.]